MSELKAQTMSAAMAAAIMEDVNDLVEKVVELNKSIQLQSESAKQNIEASVSSMKQIHSQLANENSHIYNSLSQLLADTKSVRQDMKRLAAENTELSKRYRLVSVLSCFLMLCFALLTSWLIWG